MVCRATPKVFHLFFANDTLIFSKASVKCSKGVLNSIMKYGEASSQQINYNKSSFLFSLNVNQQIQEQIIDCFEIRSMFLIEKYLGLLSMIGRF